MIDSLVYPKIYIESRSAYDNTKKRVDSFKMDKGFIEAFENYFIDNIKKTAIKYGIEKYEFEMGAGNVFFSYTFERGRLSESQWNKVIK